MKVGDPSGSELIRRVQGESQPRMPLTGPPFLSEEEIALLEAWVQAGMPAGDVAAATRQSPPVPPRPEPDEIATFEHVQPILLKRCVKCHKENGKMGPPPEGLRLDSYAKVIAGGERLVIVPGKPGLSELIRRIEGKALPRMPFDGPPWLDEEDLQLLRQWVQQGACNAAGEPMPIPQGRKVRFRGRMTGPSAVDGAEFILGDEARVDKDPRVGDQIELRGVVDEAGNVRANRLRKR
jgi:mono/diheme cytochrome c family protein